VVECYINITDQNGTIKICKRLNYCFVQSNARKCVNLIGIVDYVLKGASEKLTKQMEAQLSEMNSRIEESQRTVIDINSQKSRLKSEVAELNRQLEDAEHNVGTLSKDKSSLSIQLEESRRSLDDETRVSPSTQI
jgi:septal ring factor EnvC (AmiA/AmiB activator)